MRPLLVSVSLILVCVSSAHALVDGVLQSQKVFPSSVAFVLTSVKAKTKCSATKIAPQVFLTAAHCFDDFFDEHARGTIEMISSEWSPKTGRGATVATVDARLHIVGQPVIHPDYYRVKDKWFESLSHDNADLAIFKTDRDIAGVTVAGLNVVPLRENIPISIGGYGLPVDQPAAKAESRDCGVRPCELQMGLQKINKVLPNQFNAVTTDHLSSYINDGDSGGPVYVRTSRGLFVVGVNSTVDGLGRPNTQKASWFVSVDTFWPWIHSVTQSLLAQH